MEKPNVGYQDKTQTLNIDNSNINLNNSNEFKVDLFKNEKRDSLRV